MYRAFNDSLYDFYRSIISKPYPVQAYAWPAIVRNRHVVGVDRGKSGKTLGYVLPILKQLVDTPECYKSLPKGTGVSLTGLHHPFSCLFYSLLLNSLKLVFTNSSY